MTSEAITQISVAVSAIAAAMFFTIRYIVKESNKSKQQFMDFIDKQTLQNLDYNENKNGHLERISKSFALAMNKNARAMDKLSEKITSHHNVA